MTASDEHDALAAEYVLGTLDLAERQEAEALLARDRAFAAAVAAWERLLAPLAETILPIEPARDLWPGIAARIAPPALSRPSADIIALDRRLRRWRTAAWVSTALAASLAAVVLVRELRPPPAAPDRFVAVLQRDAASPAFVVSVDIAARSVVIRPVAASAPADRSYELWLVSDALPAPRSLGVIDDGGGIRRPTALAGAEPALIRNATYAVSLEPKGGSPTGTPTGPVVFAGRLIPE